PPGSARFSGTASDPQVAFRTSVRTDEAHMTVSMRGVYSVAPRLTLLPLERVGGNAIRPTTARTAATANHRRGRGHLAAGRGGSVATGTVRTNSARGARRAQTFS